MAKETIKLAEVWNQRVNSFIYLLKGNFSNIQKIHFLSAHRFTQQCGFHMNKLVKNLVPICVALINFSDWHHLTSQLTRQSVVIDVTLLITKLLLIQTSPSYNWFYIFTLLSSQSRGKAMYMKAVIGLLWHYLSVIGRNLEHVIGRLVREGIGDWNPILKKRIKITRWIGMWLSEEHYHPTPVSIRLTKLFD